MNYRFFSGKAFLLSNNHGDDSLELGSSVTSTGDRWLKYEFIQLKDSTSENIKKIVKNQIKQKCVSLFTPLIPGNKMSHVLKLTCN